MRAAYCSKPGDLRMIDVPKPKAGPGQAVVKVRAAGVCGSDVDGYLGTHPWIGYPIILGHECSGLVDELGQGATRFKKGDPVVVEPFSVCGRCPSCLRGTYNMCRDIQIIGHHIPGCFAEYILMEERFLHPLPAGVSLDAGAVVEPMTGALHAVGRCRLSIGEWVVLLGFGTVGYFLAQHVLNSGAKLLVSEPEARKRDKARSLGAHGVLDPHKDFLLERIMDITDGVGADCVIEAVGSAETLQKTVSLVRKGGRVMLMGWIGKDPVPFDTTTLTLNELTVLGTMGFAWDFPTSLDLLARGKVEAESIITHRFPLDRCLEAIQTLHEKKEGVWKAMLVLD